jgi:hypothetical protein
VGMSASEEPHVALRPALKHSEHSLHELGSLLFAPEERTAVAELATSWRHASRSSKRELIHFNPHDPVFAQTCVEHALAVGVVPPGRHCLRIYCESM